MAETVTVYVHLEPDLKRRVETLLSEKGMTIEGAVVLLFERIANGCIDPYSPHVPNAETIEALKQAKNGEGLVEYASLDELKLEFN